MHFYVIKTRWHKKRILVRKELRKSLTESKLYWKHVCTTNSSQFIKYKVTSFVLETKEMIRISTSYRAVPSEIWLQQILQQIWETRKIFANFARDKRAIFNLSLFNLKIRYKKLTCFKASGISKHCVFQHLTKPFSYC